MQWQGCESHSRDERHEAGDLLAGRFRAGSSIGFPAMKKATMKSLVCGRLSVSEKLVWVPQTTPWAGNQP